MGIVDFLQDWNMTKRIERALKIYINRQDPGGISVMKPLPYRDRFQKKMAEIFDLEDYHEDELNHRLSASIRGSRRHQQQQQQLEQTPPNRLRSRSRSNSFTPEAISGTVMSLFRMNQSSTTTTPNEHSEVELSIIRHSVDEENNMRTEGQVDNNTHPDDTSKEPIILPKVINEGKEEEEEEDEKEEDEQQRTGLSLFTSSTSPKVKGNIYQQLDGEQDNFL